MTTPRQPRILGAATITPAELDADQWAVSSVRERIPRVRAVATAWGATVTAITGLFGLGTLAGADAVVSRLHSPWSGLFGALSLGSILAAAISLLFASWAAQPSRLTIPVDAAQRALLHDQTFDKAVERLGVSRICAGAAVVLLFLCLLVRWYGT